MSESSPSVVPSLAATSVWNHFYPTAILLLAMGLTPVALQFFKQRIAIQHAAEKRQMWLAACFVSALYFVINVIFSINSIENSLSLFDLATDPVPFIATLLWKAPITQHDRAHYTGATTSSPINTQTYSSQFSKIDAILCKYSKQEEGRRARGGGGILRAPVGKL